MTKQTLIIYIPVLHSGYLKLIDKYRNRIKNLYLIDKDFYEKLSKVKEIRAIPTDAIVKMLKPVLSELTVKKIDAKNIGSVKDKNLISLNDKTSKNIMKKYYSGREVVYETVFLRWHENNVTGESTANYDLVSEKEFDRKMMAMAESQSKESSDWWRHVGCVVVKNKKILVKAFNEHFPTNITQYSEGDPRDFIKAGQLGFLGSSAHAEQLSIAKAANKGISLKGADMYVSTYPCPACAKLAAAAGIRNCYFRGGNAYLDVEAVFKSTGLKAVLVK